MKIHAVAGLPRAGSTLMCNILNQRPDTHASSTSPLPAMLRGIMGAASHSGPEFRGLLNDDPQKTKRRMEGTVRAAYRAWYEGMGEFVFDKSRMWNSMSLALRDISPDGVILLCVRDLRAVFASTEIEERKNGLLSVAPPTIRGRYLSMFSAGGVIGTPYAAIMDVIDLDEYSDNVLIVHYEELVKDPAAMMLKVEEACGMPHYDHDFDNIPDTATDADGFYLGKFPHRASGKIENRDPHWSKVIPAAIAADIMASAHAYNAAFGYSNEEKTEPSEHAECECDDRTLLAV